MEKENSVAEKDMEEQNWRKGVFADLIGNLRVKRHVSMSQLCEGLCEKSRIFRIEKGQYYPEKLLRDRIIERLGVSADDMEVYLDKAEYDAWEQRNRILTDIIEERMEEAAAELERFRARYAEGRNAPLEEQFYLAMLGQIDAYRGRPRGELAGIYRRAACLTVPGLGKRGLAELCLSVQELNLILEAVQAGGFEEVQSRREWYREIAACIEAKGFDRISLAKIYPKAVYFLCREEAGTWLSLNPADGKKPAAKEKALEDLVALCNKGIKALREGEKAYYFVELLNLKTTLLEEMCPLLSGNQKALKEAELREAREWKSALEYIYAFGNVKSNMYEFTWMYFGREIRNVSEAIRTRRKMFGYTQEYLSSGICSERTLMRIESGEVKTSWKYIGRLLRKLGMSGEYQHGELEHGNPEVWRLMEELRRSLNRQENEKSEKILKQLKRLVAKESPVNRQMLLKDESNYLKNAGKISKKEYLRRVTNALECTVPKSRVFESREAYLTRNELQCVHNLSWAMDWGDKEQQRYIGFLERVCTGIRRSGTVYSRIGIYELLANHVASCIGDQGEFERSNEMSSHDIRYSLRMRRIPFMYEYFYNNIWNWEQQHKNGQIIYKKEERKQALGCCITLSRITKDDTSFAFFMKKYEDDAWDL